MHKTYAKKDDKMTIHTVNTGRRLGHLLMNPKTMKDRRTKRNRTRQQQKRLIHE